jgi:hypothetical protein
VLGREITPGSTILVDKKHDSEDEVEITIIPGAPPEEMEKVTVPPEEPKNEGGDDDSEENAAE